MPLSKGTGWAPYEIVALVGQGGMGEVDRAHDDSLRRDVAIKVSAERFSERFEKEARAIASLNHTKCARCNYQGRFGAQERGRSRPAERSLEERVFFQS